MNTTPAITTVANTTRVSHTKAPTLKHRDDQEAAAELEVYIQEAESGLRSIIKAGFFLECLAADLPKGRLGPWVEAHCKNRSWRTVQRWKEIAGKLGDAIGISFKKRTALNLHSVLALPLDKVPDAARSIRDKLDAEIEGKSYRQLFMEFKQADEDDPTKAKRGRRKGQGGASAAQRAAHKSKIETKELLAIVTWCEITRDTLDEITDEQRLGRIHEVEGGEAARKNLLASMEHAVAFLRRKGASASKT